MIVVIPIEDDRGIEKDKVEMFNLNKDIQAMIKKVKNLEVNDSKIQKLIYKDKAIYNYNTIKKDKLDYLGFTFDGLTVKIREKSITKYYYKTKRAIRFANMFSQQKGRNSLRKNLFKRYSHLGVSRDNMGGIKPYNPQKRQGNFLTYVYRSNQIFDLDKCTENEIKKQMKNHWKFINKRLINHNSGQIEFDIKL